MMRLQALCCSGGFASEKPLSGRGPKSVEMNAKAWRQLGAWTVRSASYTKDFGPSLEQGCSSAEISMYMKINWLLLFVPIFSDLCKRKDTILEEATLE